MGSQSTQTSAARVSPAGQTTSMISTTSTTTSSATSRWPSPHPHCHHRHHRRRQQVRAPSLSASSVLHATQHWRSHSADWPFSLHAEHAMWLAWQSAPCFGWATVHLCTCLHPEPTQLLAPYIRLNPSCVLLSYRCPSSLARTTTTPSRLAAAGAVATPTNASAPITTCLAGEHHANALS
jgi:hypothetical protein